MTLRSIDIDYKSVPIPDEIADFLQSVDSLVEEHRVDAVREYHGFVPSDYQTIYRCLKVIFDSHMLTGPKFCEWGSGISIVASLAAMIGYDSFGIEYDGRLNRVAEGIRKKFNVPVQLVQGSYVPDGVEDLIEDAVAENNGELALHPDADNAYEEIDESINDFDLIFIYPWPNDVELTHRIFDRGAAPGAMLLAYYGVDSIGLYRKR